MVEISKDDIRNQLRDWGIENLDKLEEALGRELTDDEFSEMLICLIGYADYSRSETTEQFAQYIFLTDSLGEDDIQKLRDFDKEEPQALIDLEKKERFEFIKKRNKEL